VGKRVARYNLTSGYSYYFADHLGSADVVTDAAGHILEESDYYPFGGERVVNNSQVIDVINPGFEGNSSQGWTLGYWGANSVVTNTQAHSGSYSLAQSGATTGGSFQDVSGLAPGASYQISVWVRADAGTTAQMFLWLHDTTGGNAESTTAIMPGQSWQQVTLTYVANSTGQLRIHLHYIAGAGTVYYDDVQVTALNPSGLPSFANHYKFTAKERDPETGCDYFGARYYCNPIGRFITPDWAAAPTAVPYAHFGNPQSLNLYSYVANNPTTFGDPDGHLGDSDADDPWLHHCIGCVRPKYDCTRCAIAAGPKQEMSLWDKLGAFFSTNDKELKSEILHSIIFDDLKNSVTVTVPVNRGDSLSEAGGVPVPKNLAWIIGIAVHGWAGHQDQFPDMTQKQFQDLVLETVQNATGNDVKRVDKFKTAYWNDKEDLIVIRNKRDPNGGTAFRPDEGRQFFDNLRPDPPPAPSPIEPE